MTERELGRRPEEPGAESPAATPRVLVGASDDDAERRADAFADAVASDVLNRPIAAPMVGASARVRRSATAGAIGAQHHAPAAFSDRLQRSAAAGSALPPEVRAPLERHAGSSLSDIRIHRSSDLPGQVGATAFTYERQIHFAPGTYRPGTRAGRRLIAHEVGHAVDRSDGEPRVRRFLSGSAAALNEQGGVSEMRRVRLVRKSTDPHWDKLVKLTQQHEQLEAKQRAAHRSANFMRPAAVKQLVTSLDALEVEALAWQQDPANVERLAITDDRGAEAEGGVSKYHSAEARLARKRSSLVVFMLPRIRLERQDVESGRFLQNRSRNDDTLAWSKQAAMGGNLNTVDLVAHEEGGTVTKGIFKQDQRRYEGNVAVGDGGVDKRSGNWGARSVAMSRLDEVLGSGVTARTEFATHTGSTVGKKKEQDDPNAPRLGAARAMIGTHQEMATGRAMSDYIDKGQITMIGAQAQQGQLDLADPNLQRLLSILQIVDAIAGQLDRHSGNFFVQTDPNTGAVVAVTGIDLDQSFTEKHHGVRSGDWSTADTGGKDSSFFKGVPALVDRDFALKLIALPEDKIRYAIEPLISPAELNAAMARWLQVKAILRTMEREGKLVTVWDDSTARQQTDSKTSYLGQARTAAFSRVLESVPATYKEIDASTRGNGLFSGPEVFKYLVQPLYDEIERTPDIQPEQALATIQRIIAGFADDDRYLDRRLRWKAAQNNINGRWTEMVNAWDAMRATWINQSIRAYFALYTAGGAFTAAQLPAPPAPPDLPHDMFPPMRLGRVAPRGRQRRP